MHTPNDLAFRPLSSPIAPGLAFRARPGAAPYLRGPSQIPWLTTFCWILIFAAVERVQAADFLATTVHELRVAIANAEDGDTIWLPEAGVFQFTEPYDDLGNFTGPTATKMIRKNITIEARGSLLERAAGSPRFRAFAVGSDGDLTIRNAHFKGFAVKGGNGAHGGGGGMGAGGAIYVYGGNLTVEACTLEGNSATGGNGSAGHSGGGGGMGGNGGNSGGGSSFFGGGGGGGSRGNGGAGGTDNNCPGSGCEGGGGGGGGTVDSGQNGPLGIGYGEGGFDGGGDGGASGNIVDAENGDGGGAGGGGGGGSSRRHGPVPGLSGDGGDGGYGGGGGGGGYSSGDGGHGGFGGGGGAGSIDTFGDAGNGGFGGGGGAESGDLSSTGQAGLFGGDGDDEAGGGGAGLGGAIFNHRGHVEIYNSTFTGNLAQFGAFGGGDANGGRAAGGAIFSLNGDLRIYNTTISGNEVISTAASGGGVFALRWPESGDILDVPPITRLDLYNTIIANNGANEAVAAGVGSLYPIISNGAGNLVMNNSSALPVDGVVKTDDPQLGPLMINYPGLTPTMAIAATSPAYNTGGILCQTYDQRGVERAPAAPCDIGAFEVANLAPIAMCKNMTVTAGAGCTADASIDDGSYDPDGDAITLVQSPAGPYPLGNTTVLLTVTDSLGASSSCTATVTVEAATQVSFVGLKNYWVVGVDGAPTITAQLSSVCAGCVSGGTLDFWVDLDGDGIREASEVTSLSAVNGTASLTLPGVGIYCVQVSVADTEFCHGSETDMVIISVVTPDDLANGGGRYARCDSSTGNPNVNFGFTTQWDSKAQVYRGQLLVQNNNRWRIKGNISAYAQTSTSTGQATGLASVFWWDATLNSNEGDWVLLASDVAYKIGFSDTGNTQGKKRNGAKPDAFALTFLGVGAIDPSIVAAVGPPPVCGSPQALKSGNVSIHVE